MDSIKNGATAVGAAVSHNSDEKLIAGLENILAKQLKLMRSSRDQASVELADQTSELVGIIGQKGLLKDEKFSTQRSNIQKLYQELTLATAERKNSVSDELNKIRRGKRTVGAYKQGNLPRHSNLL